MSKSYSSAIDLIYNKRFRSNFFQITLLISVILFFLWVANNANNNLTARGDSFGFGFLSNTAGFQILPTLGTWVVDYDVGKSTYFDVYLIGIINTFIIAITGIIATTILGFSIGIFRLSNNIIIKGFATIYIEAFRNIPLLLHLFFWYFAVLRILPGKREKVSLLGESFGINITGFYGPRPIFNEGWEFVVLGVLISIILVIMFSRYAKRIHQQTGYKYPTFWISSGIIILIPCLICLIYSLLYSLPIEIQFPEFKTDGPKLKRGYAQGVGMMMPPEMLALWLALVLYTASFIAEIVRAGILAIHKGQTEASYAVGLGRGETLRLIVIPQALRIIIPPLTSQYLNLTKNSSLAVAIAYPELVSIFAGTALNQVGQEIEIIFMMAMVYLTFSLLTSLFMNWFNSRIKLVER